MGKSGSQMSDYTKTMGLVKVKFNNPKYNYSTSVSGDISESEARKYFVGKMFDVGTYPKENMQKAIDIEFYPKGTYDESYSKGGAMKKANNDYLYVKAITNEQLEVLKDIIPILNKNGIQLRFGTYIGKSPQTLLFDFNYQDGILRVNGSGYNGDYLPTFDDEEFGDKQQFLEIVNNLKKEGVFAKGGAIYKGNKVRIKDSGRTMKVKSIAKGKKGYVEFTGDAGTFLKGDLEKMAKGGITNEKYRELDKISDWKIIRKKEHPKKNGVFLTLSQSDDYYKIVPIYKGKELPRTSTYFLNKKSAEEDFNNTIKKYFAKGGMMAKGGKTKKRKDPPIVRGYFDDEPYEYGQGGKIDKNDYVVFAYKDRYKILKVFKTEMEAQKYAKKLAHQYQNIYGFKSYDKFLKHKAEDKKFAKIGKESKYEQGGTMGGFNYSIGGL